MSFTKLDVRRADCRGRGTRPGEHLRRHVHTDRASVESGHPSRDQAVDTTATAHVDDVLARMDPFVRKWISRSCEGLNAQFGHDHGFLRYRCPEGR